ncbi:hypothetical protein K435DRAFT_621634, partial [Dendrothele bispora CBS 962.96]
IYYICFPKDSQYMKMAVGLLFLLESLGSSFATSGAIRSIIAYGELSDLANFWAYKTLGPLSGSVALIVHAFYSLKICQFKGHWSLVLLIILLSIVQCVTNIFVGTQVCTG